MYIDVHSGLLRLSKRFMYDLIVVGLGAMGSAAAFHAARSGVRVLGLEQFDIPHAKGSSHGYSRMIRLAYYEHSDYVPLLSRAYQLWHSLESEFGERLIYETGGLYYGPPEGHVVPGILRAAGRHNLTSVMKTGGSVSDYRPCDWSSLIQVPHTYAGAYESHAGFLRPEKCIAAHCLLAMKSGAELRAHEPVEAWEADEYGVRVRTRRGEFWGKQLLFCGGAWTDKIVADLGVPLVVTRQALGWLWPKDPERYQLGHFGVWGVEEPDGSLSYGFPMLPDNPGLKIARHGPSTPVDPDTVNRSPTAEDEAEIRKVAARLPGAADGPLLAIRICLYTNSPDGHFILDRHPRHPNVTLACGFSGHGFKFASVIGEAMSQLSLTGHTAHPIAFLDLSRFRTR
jgi:sarcosine oxidase